jgi:hypothetical protein
VFPSLAHFVKSVWGTSTKDVLVHIAIFHLRTSPIFLRVQVKVLVRNLMRTSTCTPSRVQRKFSDE